MSEMSLIGVTDLVSILLQCFALILVGYLSGRYGLIGSEESKGLSAFVTYFSLPALIFNTLATSDLADINWSLVYSIFISKAVIFVLVIIITLILTKPLSCGKAALYGILCTQSNDFAIGYPIMASLYRTSHPQFARYLYVLAPIQLVVLNPIALFLMQFNKHSVGHSVSQSSSESIPNTTTHLILYVNVLKQIMKNPIIFMTVLGIVWNYLFNHSIPDVLSPFFDVLSQSFSACALFLLGLNLVGKFQLINSSLSILLVPLVLVMTKILVFPLLTRVIIQQLIVANNDTLELSNFGFLYGTIPSAPTVFIFALQYELSSTIVSAAMVMSTILSAPLMFVSANMIRLAANSLPYTAYQEDLGYTMCYSSLLSIFCVLWLLLVLLCGYKWKSVTHRCTLALTVSQLSIAIGGYLWQFVDNKSPLNKYYLTYHLQYMFAVGGTLSARIWTAMISVTLALLHYKSLCYVIRIHKRLSSFSCIITLLLLILVIYVPNYPTNNIDPNFEFGSNQAIIAICMLILCLVLTLIGLIVQHYFSNRLNYQTSSVDEEGVCDSLLSDNVNQRNSEFEIVRPKRVRTFSRDSNTSFNDNLIVEVEDLISSDLTIKDLCSPHSNCSRSQRKECISQIKRYRERHISEANEVTSLFNGNSIVDRYSLDYHQIYHHIFLLLILSLSMLIGLVVSIGKLVLEKPTGIFIELEFLDILLNYGQGVITFLIFGLEITPVYDQISKLLWKRSLNASLVKLPPIESLSPSTKHICDQFKSFHQQNCMNAIVIEHESGPVFNGTNLVNWLIAAGLCSDRKQAECYGRHLLIGRLIQHISNCQHFHDSSFQYIFNTSA